jgi:predicted transcriptional regulator
MKKILISINPEYVDLILSRVKKYEYRKSVAKEDIKSILVYCTYPRMKVVAEVEIKDIISDTPENLWERTKSAGGVDKKFFDEYFKNRKTAHAYVLGKILKFAEPKDLADFGCKFAPQSFVYIEAV